MRSRFKKVKRICLLTLLTSFLVLGFTSVSFSKTQDSTLMRNEIGIDIANFLTFLERNIQSSLVNYKYHFTQKHAFRTGLNLFLSTGREEGNYVDVKVGYEYDIRVSRWTLFPGADLSFNYAKGNFQPNWGVRLGVSPLIGVRYNFSPHFSVSSEIKLNFFCTIYRNPESFDSTGNGEIYKINIGEVGMINIAYHFNLGKKKKR